MFRMWMNKKEVEEWTRDARNGISVFRFEEKTVHDRKQMVGNRRKSAS